MTRGAGETAPRVRSWVTLMMISSATPPRFVRMQPEQKLVYAARRVGGAADLPEARVVVLCGLNLPQRGRLPIISTICLATVHAAKAESMKSTELGNNLIPGTPGGRHLTKK